MAVVKQSVKGLVAKWVRRSVFVAWAILGLWGTCQAVAMWVARCSVLGA